MTRGVCLIAYGDKAEEEAQQCIESLTRWHNWPYRVAGDDGSVWRFNLQLDQPHKYTAVQKSRYAKVTLDQWSPFDDTLYLDADTRIQGDLSIGFECLADDWDMVITASASQGSDNMWHIAPQEREATFEVYQCSEVLQLQGGVFWFRRNPATRTLFSIWRQTWQCFEQFDQAALLRALHIAPVKLHLLGRPFNGGSVVVHRHGSMK